MDKQESEVLYMAGKGLTLVEMIIGLAVTAVLAATVLVSFNFVDGRKLDTQARNMVSDLIWGRELAASNHHDYIVDFDIANETYSFYNGSKIAARLVRQQKLSVNLVNVTNWNHNTIPDFTFYAPKGNTSSTVLITLNQTGRSRIINVSNETGFIKMEQ
jgi:prepilin-type N-terminal cleavage/methylation domain-containing protein